MGARRPSCVTLRRYDSLKRALNRLLDVPSLYLTFPDYPSQVDLRVQEGQLGAALLLPPEREWAVSGALVDTEREAFTVRWELQRERSCRTTLLSFAAMSAKEPSVAWWLTERIRETSPGGDLSGGGLSGGRLRPE
jgi:hypothetical protein